MATKIIRPISDAITNGWTNSDETTENLYSYIDEIEASDDDDVYKDLDYREGPIPLLFGFESSDLGYAEINKITLYCRGYQSKQYSSQELTFYIDSELLGVGQYKSFPKISYGTIVFESTTNPKTSLPWTVSDLNNLICGLTNVCESEIRVHVSQMYIVVDYVGSDENYSANYSLILGE